MTEQEGQVGRKKEAPLEVVGSSGSKENEYKKVLTPEDAEYVHYTDLLKGFFQKFARWKEILSAEEYQRNDKKRGFDIFSSSHGTYITPIEDKSTSPTDFDTQPGRILRVSSMKGLDIPKHNLFTEDFFIFPGAEGRQHFLDPEDSKPLEEIRIHVSNQPPVGRSIKIETTRFAEDNKHFNYRQADYELQEDRLRISHKYYYYGVMTDAYATTLLSTIDTLIPHSSTATPNERKGGIEPPKPKLPPAKRRRPTGQ